MMGQLAAQKDVESLEMSRGTRSRCCLDAFLVTSVVFLFLAVAAVAAVVVMTQPRPILNRPDATSAAEEERAERAPSLQNFAYLQATQSDLLNRTVTLTERLHGDRRSVGRGFRFGKDNSLLTPLIEGNYFMFVKVNLTCVHHCTAGRLRLDVGDQLRCELLIPARTDTPQSKQCWTVQMLGSKGLQTTMTVRKLENWKLDLDTSGVGMFLVGTS